VRWSSEQYIPVIEESTSETGENNMRCKLAQQMASHEGLEADAAMSNNRLQQTIRYAARRCTGSLPPQLLEPCRVGGGVANGVLNVAVPEIVLDQASVRTVVGEGKAVGMAQDVGMDVGMHGHRQLGLLAVFAQGEVDG